MINPEMAEIREPMSKLDLAKYCLETASLQLGHALKDELDPLTREQIQDILDKVDNTIDAIENLGV